MILIDLFLLIQMYLPPILRETEPDDLWIQYYLQAGMKPLNDVKTSFYSYFNAVEYELLFNGQVMNLEHLLNNEFDEVERRIHIEDGIQNPIKYLYNQAETNEPIYLNNASEDAPGQYIYNHSETAAEFDFIVYVPVGFVYDEILMRYYVNKYRAAGKRFTILEEI